MELRYGVIGLGPVGVTLACHLRQAGHEVSVYDIDRNKLAVFTERPLIVSGRLNATAQLNDICFNLKDLLDKKPDVILICVKTCYSLSVLQEIKKLESNHRTVLIACQNGLDIEEQIIDTFGSHRALRMVLNMGCGLVQEHESHVIFVMKHYLSLRKPVDAPLTEKVAQDFSKAGFPTETKEDYRVEAFKKCILNSSMGTVCALTGFTMRQCMQEKVSQKMVREILREGIAVAQAMDLAIPTSYLDEAMNYLSHGGGHKPSILVDIENHRETENEYHCGKIFHYASKYGIEVPVNQTLYYLLQCLEKNPNRKVKKKEMINV